MTLQVIEDSGKRWLRQGECNHCGECCLEGFKQICPHVDLRPDLTTRCKIYDRRVPDDPEALEKSGIITTACVNFPATPQDIRATRGVANKCGYWFTEVAPILLACSTFDGKQYCHWEWLKAVRQLQKEGYPQGALDILIVDNSDKPDYYIYLQSLLLKWPRTRVERLELQGTGNQRLAQTNEYIRQRFLKGEWAWWFNLESDVVVPPHTLTELLKATHIWKDLDWIGDSYRSRDRQQCQSNFGCSLFSRRMMERVNFNAVGDNTSDGHLWRLIEPGAEFRCVDVYDLIPEIRHA